MSSTSKVFLMLLFFVLLNASCSNKKQTPKPVSLEPVRSVSQLNDSTFFGDVWALKFANKRLYLADNQPQVFQLDADLNLLGRIDKKGKGPGEFTSVSDICMVNDSLYLYSRSQAKILAYDDKNKFIRETGLPESHGSNLVVDKRGHIYLSTPDYGHPIIEYNAEGQKLEAFGSNTVGKDNKRVLRNSRFLFIYNDRLIAVGRSEPLVEIYSLEGKPVSKTKIAPPEIKDAIVQVRKDNEGTSEKSGFALSNLFYGATMYKNNIYLMEAKHTAEGTNTYEKKFTYLFKYKLESNGDVTFERTFKLFRPDRDKLLYGFQLAAVEDHKLIVYDLMGKSLLVFEDERI